MGGICDESNIDKNNSNKHNQNIFKIENGNENSIINPKYAFEFNSNDKLEIKQNFEINRLNEDNKTQVNKKEDNQKEDNKKEFNQSEHNKVNSDNDNKNINNNIESDNNSKEYIKKKESNNNKEGNDDKEEINSKKELNDNIGEENNKIKEYNEQIIDNSKVDKKDNENEIKKILDNKESSKNENIEKEKDNKTKTNIAFIKKENKILNNFIKNAFCTIMLNDKELGKGFFCLIPFPNKNNQSLVLIINCLLIKENINVQGNLLTIKLNENKGIYLLELDNNRKIYEDNDFNITFIEIKKAYKNIFAFVIDGDLDKDNSEDIYNQQNILLIDYSFKENKNIEYNFEYIYGLSHINKILSENENKYENGLIINSKNNKIIGIIKKKSSILLKKSLIKFYEKYKAVGGIIPNKENNIILKSNTILYNNYANSKINKLNNIFIRDYSPYIKSLLISFFYIEKLQIFFLNNNHFFILKNCEIANLINLYMNNYSEQNFQICDKVIYDLNKRINELNNNNNKSLNFEQLIDFILSKLHKELNNKQILRNEIQKDDEVDEIMAYNNTIKNFYEQNDSYIQNIFFGFKEIINTYNCCKIIKYNFELCKYITFNIDKIDDLQNLISDLESKYIPFHKYCSKCKKNSDILIQHKLITNRILVIIINNKNKIQMKFNTIIHTQKYEYKLLCCITESKDKTNFNIIFNSKNIWYAIKNNENYAKEVGNEIGLLIMFPCILFFEKGNKLNISNNKNLGISINSKIVMKNNSGIMTNNINDSNLIKVYNNNIIHNQHNLINIYKDINALPQKNSKNIIHHAHTSYKNPQYNFNNGENITTIAHNTVINNPYEKKIKISNINNNQMIKKNEININTKKDNNQIKNSQIKNDYLNEKNNILPDTKINNNKNDINLNSGNETNYNNIKNNKNMNNYNIELNNNMAINPVIKDSSLNNI